MSKQLKFHHAMWGIQSTLGVKDKDIGKYLNDFIENESKKYDIEYVDLKLSTTIANEGYTIYYNIVIIYYQSEKATK